MAASGRESPCLGTSPACRECAQRKKGRRSGPSLVSDVLCLADAQTDVFVDAVAVEQEHEVLVALLLRLFPLLRRLGGSADGLLVDRDDHVARLDTALGRRAVRRHLRDDDTLDLTLDAELFARLAVKLTEVKAKRARLLGHRLVLLLIAGRGLLLVVRHLADIRLQTLVLAVAPAGA